MRVAVALLLLLPSLVSVLGAGSPQLPLPQPQPQPGQPQLRRLGLYLPGFYETTPVVFGGELLLVECIHAGRPMLAAPAAAGVAPQPHTYYRVRQPGYGGKLVVPIVPGSVGFHFVAAVVVKDPSAERGEALWLTGTVDPPLGSGPHGRTQIFTWVSRDAGLQHWDRTMSLQLPAGYSAWNTDVSPAAGGDGSFVMAIELQAPAAVVGTAFSTAFALCDRCGPGRLATGWKLLNASNHLFTKARYNACPTIRYLESDGYYYLLTLFDDVPPGSTFDTVIVRSKDLTSDSWSPAPSTSRIVLAPNNTAGSIEHHVMPGSTLDICGTECERWNGSIVPAQVRFPPVHMTL
eukprot:SAG22_NODE_559_length_9115_cov_4.969720_2_plen_348_part_00